MTVTKTQPTNFLALPRSTAVILCGCCRSATIPLQSFAYLTPSKRLVSAVCVDCDRRVTLKTATWMRAQHDALAHPELRRL
jgi:hypothetical protein